MNDILITVAVICYNNEKYIGACLDTVVSQQGDDLEIVLVDDASTDSSYEICKQYAEKDSRIHLIRHERNAKASGARNTILENAHGKWITFVDGDDMLTLDAISIMRRYAGSEAEMVAFHYSTFENGAVVVGTPEFQAEILDKKENLELYKRHILRLNVKGRFRNLPGSTPWAKLWRMDFLREHGLKFDVTIPRAEDCAFNFLCSHYFTRIETVPENTYIYRRNESSVSVRFQKDIVEKQTLLLTNLSRTIRTFGEAGDSQLMSHYYGRCGMALREICSLGVYHPKCPWNKAERLAFLQGLYDLDWVRESAAHSAQALCNYELERRLLKAAHERRLDALDGELHRKALLRRVYYGSLSKYGLFRKLNALRKQRS